MSADNQPQYNPTHMKIFAGCLVFLLGLAVAGFVNELRGGNSDLQVGLILGGTAIALAVMMISDRHFRGRS
jgi:hypothetical protein